MATPGTKVRHSFVAVALFAMATLTAGANAQISQDAALRSPLEPLRSGIAENKLFAELIAHNELRSEALLGYTALRIYQVVDLNGKVHAEEIGRMEYRAPDNKTFVITSEKGSGLTRHLALNPLIASEVEAAAGKEHRESSLTPANYHLEPIGEQQVGPYHCIVAQAVPKRRDKYLFEGKVWIDDQDYAVVRIEGHPAKKLSFWIEQANFVRQYQKIDEFWLPQRDETSVQVRLYGNKILTINHQDYSVRRTNGKYESALNVRIF